jgi:hypothetical protein
MAKKGSALGNTSYQLVTVDDLTGGVDLRRSPSLLQPVRARTLRNVSLQEPGAWQPYPGWRIFTTAGVGAACVGARRIYLKDATFTLAGFAHGYVLKPSDAGAWGAAVLSGRSTTAQHHFTYDRNLVALFDSQAPMVKSVDGTVWTAFGIDKRAGAGPGLVAVAGGSLVVGNTYEVAYTYADDALSAESNASAVTSGSLAAGQGTLRVTVGRSADPQVDTIYIYARNVTAGESVLRRAGSVPNPAGATTTFDITNPNFFPDGLEVPTRHDLPKAMSYGVVWRNRWWGLSSTVGNRIHFTEVFLPQAWPDLFYVDIPFEKGDKITGLIALGDTLAVFGNTGVFLIIGQTSLDFEVRPSSGAVAGSVGVRACWVIEQGVVHAAEGGVYIFDGASDRLLSDSIITAWRDVMEHATPAEVALIAVTYHERRKEVRVTVPRLFETDGPGEWILDLSRTREQETEAWTSTDRAIGGYIPWDGKEAVTGDQGRLLSWERITSGRLCEESVGMSANGADMVCVYEGPALLAAPRRWTRFIDLFGEYAPSPGQFSMEVRVDDAAVTTLSFAIAASISAYTVSTYGVSPYGGRLRRNFTSMLPLTSEGLTLSLRATYKGQSLFRWFTYAIGHRPEPQLRGF